MSSNNDYDATQYSDKMYSSVEEFIAAKGGSKVITRVLVANNGLAAVKGIRSIRKWAYRTFGNDRAIRFIVMATPEDIQANAEYIRLADECIEVPGGSNVNNYANVGLIVDLAEQTGAHAVWAGWGHASENPSLPDALTNTRDKIAFIGPPAGPMQALGDKISSSIIAESARVPTLPWSGSGLTVPDDAYEVPDDIFMKATIDTVEAALESAAKIGYPLMIKASEGGGGKGIRKVSNDEELKTGFKQVQAEVPGSPIFLMKLAPESRHLEVQLLADQHGNAIALAGRDCSVQRRHQKIIEEGPIVSAPPEVVEEMEKAAVRLAKKVNYVGLGTVEYLYGNGKFYFLELNPRLQVEHPVTEWITNVNLPAAQLNAAMGIPLYRIPDIRRLYGEDPNGDTPIDFDNRKQVRPKGHVIAVRLTAENPDAGFQPTGGAVQELTFRNSPNLWGYFSIGSVGGIHSFADSQFGHIFAWGETRENARKTMFMALSEISIRGDIRNTVQYVKKLLEREDFIQNNISTTWLDGLIAQKLAADKPDPTLAVICGALHTAHAQWESNKEKFIWFLERGQNPPPELLRVHFPLELIYDDHKYTITATRSGRHSFTLSLNGSYVHAEIRVLRDQGLLVIINNNSHVSYATEEPSGLKVIVDGKTCIFTKENDPSKLRANMAGKIVRFLVSHGSHVEANTPYVELEVMKMILPLVVPLSGTIKLKGVEGNTIEAGDILAEMDLDDPSQIKRAIPFEGKIPEMKVNTDDRPHKALQAAIQEIKTLLNGYDYPGELFEKRLASISSSLRRFSDPNLILYEFKETMSILRASFKKSLKDAVNTLVDDFKAGVYTEFPLAQIKQLFDEYAASLSQTAKDKFLKDTDLLYEFFKRYDGGYRTYAFSVLESIAKQYLAVEKLFDQGKRREAVLLELREQYKDNLAQVFEINLSNSQQSRKNKIILAILNEVDHFKLVNEFLPLLNQFSLLSNKSYSEVVLKAKQMLMTVHLPSFEKKQNDIEEIIKNALNTTSSKQEALRVLIDQSAFSFDHLVTFFSHSDEKVLSTAIEVYIRKAYCTFDIEIIQSPQPDPKTGFWATQWKFSQKLSQPNLGGFNKKEGIVGSISSDSLSTLNASWKSREMDSSEHIAESENEDYNGFGTMALFESVTELEEKFTTVLKMFGADSAYTVNVLKIALKWQDISHPPSEQALVDSFTDFLDKYRKELKKLDIRRVTFLVIMEGQFPYYYTFRQRLGYKEDPIYRHIEPTLAFQLCLRKLHNYDIQRFPIENPQVHVYYAEKKKRKSSTGRTAAVDYDKRFFVRTLVLQGDIFTSENPEEFQISEAERHLVDSLNALELATADRKYGETYGNHIFINFLPEIVVEPEKVQDIFKRFQDFHAKKLVALRVSEVEVKLNIKISPKAKVIPLRFVATNTTGFFLKVDIYQEIKDINTGRTLYSAIDAEVPGALHGQDINTPHPLLNPLEVKRIVARNNETSYVYDFPFIFKMALKKIWKTFLSERKRNVKETPKTLLKYVELVLDDNDNLTEVPEIVSEKNIGKNNIGMVAWKFTLFTPEYPNGRDVIVIANDITFQSGSFGPREDLLFQKASEYSRKLGLPRVYLAANSGARIGLAQEVKEVYRVAWVNEDEPSQGYKYLYVTDEDYQKLSQTKSINAELIEEVVGDKVEKRWKIIDIIGEQDGLGVENLSGSGMIAGETSRAYEQVFTISYVSCRTVGIGAYLVRLGQRTIQHRRPPILLTGAPALNKVLGKEVYTSNVQLGGIQIMYSNGVSHLVVNDDLKGAHAILQWLSYIPERAGAPLPIVDPIDPVDRDIEFVPVKDQQYDPRHMLAGMTITPTTTEGSVAESGDGQVSYKWVSGFFDKNSFMETLGGWAKNVVCGRARLGGIPVGVIAVETRTTEHIIPADPADAKSQEKIVQKAGQVWYPDSSFKTAQAIKDFNHGEELPLFIFANWRGFSGGMRDMFDEVLKFGSYIVDALVEYKHPIFVYIPPHAELRGGAWVVVDPKINPDQMEMFADLRSRGGVLEPSGIAEIKYRERDVYSDIRRLDPEYARLQKALAEDGITEQRIKEIKDQMAKREKKLLPIYKNIAIAFCDLHDTAGRMKAKGSITRVVEWHNARKTFYWRLRRRLLENSLFKGTDMPLAQKRALLREWLSEPAQQATPSAKAAAEKKRSSIFKKDKKKTDDAATTTPSSPSHEAADASSGEAAEGAAPASPPLSPVESPVAAVTPTAALATTTPSAAAVLPNDDDDKAIVELMEASMSRLQERLKEHHRDQLKSKVSRLCSQDPEAALEALLEYVKTAEASSSHSLRALLKEKVKTLDK